LKPEKLLIIDGGGDGTNWCCCTISMLQIKKNQLNLTFYSKGWEIWCKN